jgi:hypothetical protein
MIHEGALLPGETILRYDPQSLASGVYFCRFEALGRAYVQRLVYLR